jgi:lysophospholipase L1-like esterase
MRGHIGPENRIVLGRRAVALHASARSLPSRVCLFAALTLGLLGSGLLSAAGLEDDFCRPPDSAKPGVYWFWINGNITSNGITADLEAMQRVGLGSVLIMEVSRGEPAGPVSFMSREWRNLFQHTLAEARRLKLEVIMNNSAGWEGSGGPWITPEQSMQELVWNETNAVGPKRLECVLMPPTTPGAYYRDVAVLAFPATDAYRIPGIELKAAYSKAVLNRMRASPGPGANRPFTQAIERRGITNLSARLGTGSRLVWDAPPGEWTIMRFGHASSGVGMKPVPQAGQGLNCDKLSRAGIEANFAGMMAKLARDTGLKPEELRNSGLVATHIDSWENGAQNWTASMPAEFAQRRGYDPLPFLPIMTGRVIGSPGISERFLRDLRQTISELVVENYAGRMRELANAQGLRFTCEAYNGPCDDISYGGQADMPVGEFWAPDAKLIETCKGMASAAHVYGKQVVAAESFTANARERGYEHPGSLKVLADQAFCAGINRLFLHRFTLQPWAEQRCPGMGMGPFGIRYERTQTWWEWTPSWHQYLARCQFMLQEGKFVADICYLQPQTPPQRVSNQKCQGYDWDECTADVVLTRMAVQDGRIVTPAGASYRVLVVPDSRTATPELLRKLKELVVEGATVIGPKPIASPSLSNFPTCDDEVKLLATELWGDCDGQRLKEHRLGKGRVVWGEAPEELLRLAGVPPDFNSEPPLRYIHRKTAEADLYFLANPQPQALTAGASFRISGKIPELWWPETGCIERASVWSQDSATTRIVVPLGPAGSVFVVFRANATNADPFAVVKVQGKETLSARSPSSGESTVQVHCDQRGKAWIMTETAGAYEFVSSSDKVRRVIVPALPPPQEVPGPWLVRFAANGGAPAEVTLPELTSWSQSSDPRIRYFSGRATYSRSLSVPQAMLEAGRQLYLDLGRVAVIAWVKCNGVQLGTLWKPPFRIELTGVVNPGENQLEVEVVNLWANRQIGDEQLPDDSERLPAGASEHQPAGLIKEWPEWLKQGKPSPAGRYTFASWRLWKKDDVLLESGLLGPVRLCCVSKQWVTPSTTVVPAPPPDAPNGPKQKRAETVLKRARDNPGECDVIFLGDSITEQWETGGSNVWHKYYGQRKCLNFGVGGDRTQRVLWRFEQGQLDGLKPKVVVLMIGTNNSNNEDNTEGEILEGVQEIVRELRKRLPDSKILVLGIFPRGATFSPQRGKVLQVNQALARVADGQMIHYLDVGGQFVEPDGSISPEVMPGYVHLSERGYEIWAETMEPKIKELLGQ